MCTLILRSALFTTVHANASNQITPDDHDDTYGANHCSAAGGSGADDDNAGVLKLLS